MLSRIRREESLVNHIVDTCCDEGICLDIDESIPKEDILIIKVDDYYNSQKLGKKTPPSPDCLIIIKCKDGSYSLHVAELKNITTSRNYDIENMLNKFTTCFDDFISVRFKELLFKDYKKIKLYFVSKIDIHSKDMGLKYELLTNYKVKYDGKNHYIRAFVPIPVIKTCY